MGVGRTRVGLHVHACMHVRTHVCVMSIHMCINACACARVWLRARVHVCACVCDMYVL